MSLSLTCCQGFEVSRSTNWSHCVHAALEKNVTFCVTRKNKSHWDWVPPYTNYSDSFCVECLNSFPSIHISQYWHQYYSLRKNSQWKYIFPVLKYCSEIKSCFLWNMTSLKWYPHHGGNCVNVNHWGDLLKFISHILWRQEVKSAENWIRN